MAWWIFQNVVVTGDGHFASAIVPTEQARVPDSNRDGSSTGFKRRAPTESSDPPVENPLGAVSIFNASACSGDTGYSGDAVQPHRERVETRLEHCRRAFRRFS